MIVAKPVVTNKFWIIKDGEVKIGEMERSPTGVRVSVNAKQSEFRTISMAAERLNIAVDKTPVPKSKITLDMFAHLPVDGKIHNPVYDLQLKAPLYTKEAKSKCQYAAGWYKITQKADPEWVLCPKVILLQRYKWEGPFAEPQQ